VVEESWVAEVGQKLGPLGVKVVCWSDKMVDVTRSGDYYSNAGEVLERAGKKALEELQFLERLCAFQLCCPHRWNVSKLLRPYVFLCPSCPRVLFCVFWGHVGS
jgi:hypothetical protein